MNKDQYTRFRILIVILIAASISFLVARQNYILPIVIMVTGIIVMYQMKKRVKDVLADERDWRLAGRSAMVALYIYSLISAFGGFILLALSGKNSEFAQIAYGLFYSVCFLLLLNSFIFQYYRRKGDK